MPTLSPPPCLEREKATEDVHGPTEAAIGAPHNANHADCSYDRGLSFSARTLQRYLPEEYASIRNSGYDERSKRKSKRRQRSSSPVPLTKRELAKSILLNPFVTSSLAATACTAMAPALMQFWMVFFVSWFLFAIGVRIIEFGISKVSGESVKENPLYEGTSGKLIMAAGVNIPMLIAIITTACASLSSGPPFPIPLMYASAPVANLLAWSAIKTHQNTGLAFRYCLLLTSLLLQSATLVTLLNQADKLDFAVTIVLSLVAPLVVSLILARNLRMNRATGARGERNATIAALVVAGLCAAPLLPSLTTTVLLMVLTTDNGALRQLAWSKLNKTEVLSQLKTHISSRWKAGDELPYVPDFLSKKGLYILTGDADLTGRNYYSAPVVGARSESLKLTNSTVSTTIKPNDMSADFNCSLTMLTNNNWVDGEGKAELLLPPGFVIEDLQLYDHTQPNTWQTVPPTSVSPAEFGKKTTVQAAYVAETSIRRDPALVTMVAPDRVMIQCAPLLNSHPTEVKLKFSAPLIPDETLGTATVRMPIILNSNAGSVQPTTVLVESTTKLTSAAILDKRGVFHHEVSPGAEVSIPLPPDYSAVIPGTDIVRKVKRQGGHQRKFVIAIDASISNKAAKQSLKSVLEKPATNICGVIIADPSLGVREYAVSSAHLELSKMLFKGGDNNWSLLEQAIRKARTESADVLWIHGAKPWQEVGGADPNNTWLGSIGYSVKCPADLAALCGGAVKIYDVQTVCGGNEVMERIQASAGDTSQFQTVLPTDSLAKDISGVLNTSRDVLRFEQSIGTPLRKIDGHSPSFQQQQHMFDLCAAQKRSEAEDFAIQNKLLSPFTAVKNSHVNEPTKHTPPKESDNATVIQGVNTAGTVRVDNLANLEAMLNILANCGEIGYCCWGIGLLCMGLSKLSSRQGKVRAVFGAGALILGLAIPGMINWLVASSRDGSGFS